MTRLSNKRKRTCSESTHDLGRHDLSDNSHASDLAETTTIRTSRNMTETMSTVFYAGAKFSKEALYEKARAICSQFNCRTRITTNKEETHATLECSGNNYKRARKEESNSEKHPMQDDREQCPFYIFAHVEKNNEELWGVCHANLEHNHAFIDESIMIGCKQIPLEDFDFACKMIRRDFEPKLVLQVSLNSVDFSFFFYYFALNAPKIKSE
ncbi:hypothetical protein BD560DRAFT_395312 [Blakeslea trispora]|nr:hypothetical protein BD560DRAFT_395312 [Blakeslea trispora]